MYDSDEEGRGRRDKFRSERRSLGRRVSHEDEYEGRGSGSRRRSPSPGRRDNYNSPHPVRRNPPPPPAPHYDRRKSDYSGSGYHRDEYGSSSRSDSGSGRHHYYSDGGYRDRSPISDRRYDSHSGRDYGEQSRRHHTYSHGGYDKGYSSSYNPHHHHSSRGPYPPRGSYRGRGVFPKPHTAPRPIPKSTTAIMSFSSFMATQRDGILESEAIKNYDIYKTEHKKQQLNHFFVHHKDEEWFKLKYHPEESVKKKEEQKQLVLKRVQIFRDLWDNKKLDHASVDGDQVSGLLQLLDNVNNLLGEDDDSVNELESKDEINNKDEDGTTEKPESGNEENLTSDETKSQDEEQKEISEKLEDMADEVGQGLSDEKNPKDKKEHRRSTGSNSGSELSEGATSDYEGGPDEQKKDKDCDSKDVGSREEPVEDNDDNSSNALNTSHSKVCSIFLRNIAPCVTKQDIENLCTDFPKYLRCAIGEPQAERSWFRRGWVTFAQGADLQEVCDKLSGTFLGGSDLKPMINREVPQRVQTITGLAVDQKVVRNDIRLAAKVIANLDNYWGLWMKTEPSTNSVENDTVEDNHDHNAEESSIAGLESSNPVLEKITDYLIEEASTEEDELLGMKTEEGEIPSGSGVISRDEKLIKVLDHLLFYLRLVHSIDFYNHSQYPNEDDMPHRCGVMHARGIPSKGEIKLAELEDYCNSFEKQLLRFLTPRTDLNEEEAKKLGLKDEDEEVEKFVTVNDQDIGDGKSMCALCEKKFKGSEFVKKHILSKHGTKIEEIRSDVVYYNNFLKDPKRPSEFYGPQQQHYQPQHHSKYPLTGTPGKPIPQYMHDDAYRYEGAPRKATSFPVYNATRGNPYARGYSPRRASTYGRGRYPRGSGYRKPNYGYRDDGGY